MESYIPTMADHETLKGLMRGVRLLHVAEISGIPIATLWRWREKNAVPGHPPVKALHLKRLKEAVRRARLISMEEIKSQRLRNRALMKLGMGERYPGERNWKRRLPR